MDEKLETILEKLERLDSLFSRRLMEDRAKNQLIEEVKSDLAYRRDLDTGVALADLMKGLLNIIDRLDNVTNPTLEFTDSVQDELFHILNSFGLEPLPVRGKADPSVHEIIQTEPTRFQEEDLEILATRQFGFRLGDRVLRPAKVTVLKYEAL